MDPLGDGLYEGRGALRANVAAVRWESERAVLNLWQPQYEDVLLHDRGLDDNRLAEKLLERLAFAEADWPDDRAEADRRTHSALADLEALGVTVERPDDAAALRRPF